MEPVISDLLDSYERGSLSRRELVAGLSALTAAGGGSALAQEPPPSLTPRGIDHVSILTADLQRSASFYNRVFGLVPVSEDAKNKILRLAPKGATGGTAGVGPVLVSLRQQPPAGMVDHWCFKVDGFNAKAATETLRAHGLSPANNIEYGFHIKDPDGVVVQMV